MRRTRPPSQIPSPLVGEGGGPRPPGEGAVPRARRLRKDLTFAERKLWHALRSRRFLDCKFRRQVPLGPYVADFLSFESKLVVEVDGSQHAEDKQDAVRDAWFAREGFRTLRFWNPDVLRDLNVVLATIEAAVTENPPHPAAARPPSPTRGEGRSP